MKPEISSKQKISILIVEDDPFARAIVSEALKGIRDYKIERYMAGSQKEGLMAFKTSRPQIALVDIGLPDGDGFVLLKNFKEQDPNCWVVMVTASRVEADIKQALALGAADYIVKPFNTKRIKAVIRAYLESKT
jgi:two-component system OmpR family response regulator